VAKDRFACLHADEAINFFAIFYDQQCWDAASRESPGRPRVSVDIKFSNEDFSHKLTSEYRDRRGDHSARATPSGPHIEKYRQV